MINWINGHSKIFKCLVNHDGIFSLRNLYYSTEVILVCACFIYTSWVVRFQC